MKQILDLLNIIAYQQNLIDCYEEACERTQYYRSELPDDLLEAEKELDDAMKEYTKKYGKTL